MVCRVIAICFLLALPALPALLALLALLSWRSPFLPQPSLSDKYSFHTQLSPCSVYTFLEVSLGSITMVSLSLRLRYLPPLPL